jgi:hypothetical protein
MSVKLWTKLLMSSNLHSAEKIFPGFGVGEIRYFQKISIYESTPFALLNTLSNFIQHIE